MDPMNGWQASRKLNKLYDEGILPWVPILACTAFVGEEESCRKAGMEDYLTKPVGINVLRERLKYWKAFDQRPVKQNSFNQQVQLKIKDDSVYDKDDNVNEFEEEKIEQ